jgi:hypothetical protein
MEIDEMRQIWASGDAKGGTRSATRGRRRIGQRLPVRARPAPHPAGPATRGGWTRHVAAFSRAGFVRAATSTQGSELSHHSQRWINLDTDAGSLHAGTRDNAPLLPSSIDLLAVLPSVFFQFFVESSPC